MSQKNQSQQNQHLNPFENAEESKLVDKILEKFRAKSLQEQLQSFVDVGIYDENGQITKRYGGQAPNKEQ